MTWNGTKTWTVGVDQGTASLWNAQARDNIQYNRDTKRRAIVTRDGPGTSWISSSAAYVDVGGTGYIKAQLRKRQADTFMLMKFSCSGLVDTASTEIQFAFGINLAGGPVNGSWNTAHFLFNNVSEDHVVRGLAVPFVVIGGVTSPTAVGMYTVVLRMQVVGPAGASFYFTANDYATLELREWGLD